MKHINSVKNIVQFVVAIPAGIILYIYDDILWGPGPIAIATNLFGRLPGIVGLCILYFVASYIGCYFILRRYRRQASGKNKKNQVAWLGQKLRERRGAAYGLLNTGAWTGLAISCFLLGAIVTAIPVGKLNLFAHMNIHALSLLMSFLFVFLFMGFYAGLFAYWWQFGIVRTLPLVAGIVLCFYLLNVLLTRVQVKKHASR